MMTDNLVAAEGFQINQAPAGRLIPGAFERRTGVARQPGSMGAGPFGVSVVATHNTAMSAATTAERRREGGGGPVLKVADTA
jgi:hypothetical protein